MDLQNLPHKIIEYRKESADLPDSKTHHQGLKLLLPMVERHYYINLRSNLDRQTGILRRGLWMHFPHSYEGWPNPQVMAETIKESFPTLILSPEVGEINRVFRETSELHYEFDEVKLIHRAIPELNDIDYTAERLSTLTEDYFTGLSSLFGDERKRPDDYPEFFYNFEKQCIYDRWDDTRRWVYFPIFFRHLWVSLLVARVPANTLDNIALLLPLISGIIGEKLLSLHARWGWGHPISAVTTEEEVISLMSIIAAQCGLYKLNRESSIITFTGDDTYETAGVRKVVRVADGWRQFVFTLNLSTTEAYFERLWRECTPVLKQFTKDIVSRSTVAKASIMSRNFSHNVGSHALANPKLYQSLGMKGHDNASKRLATFHSYAQGRLDFMARAMSETEERPEPLLFIGDVLNGFFHQGVLLDTLVEDAGYAANDIQFIVEIQDTGQRSQRVIYDWSGASNDDSVKNRHCFIASSNSDLKDVLVGIPGGMIGCHALYAFLENCLRNAVKYGEKSSKLILTIRLEKCKARRAKPLEDGLDESLNAWILRISDNVSVDRDRSDKDFAVTTVIREHLNTPLISDEKGAELTTQGHGIQEMKVCSETLAGGEYGIRFPADEEHGSLTCDDRCTTCSEYQGYIKATGESVLRVTTRQPLRCYSHPQGDGERRLLTYNLLLPCPILLGLVTPGKIIQTNVQQTLPDFVRHFPSIDSLAKTGAYFGIVSDSGQNAIISETLRSISRLHPALPFRLMVVTNRPEDWEASLRKKGDDGFARPDNEPFTYTKHIPARRVHIINEADSAPREPSLIKLLQSVDMNPRYKYLGATGWEAIALRVYEGWLRAYKPLPSGVDSWKLCVGFEHGGESLAAKWTNLQKSFSKDNNPNPCVSIHIASYDKPPDKGGTPTYSFSKNSPFNNEGTLDFNGLVDLQKKERGETNFFKKQILAFDNHGKIFSDVGKSTVPLSASARFYQIIGLEESLTLFQNLESPLAAPFSFAWFIYSLAEAALTTVAIVDERIALDTLGKPSKETRMLTGRERKYHKAGLFPLLTFRHANGDNSSYEFISERLAEVAQHTIASKVMEGLEADEDTYKNEWNDLWIGNNKQIPEGLTVSETCCRLGAAIKEQLQPKERLQSIVMSLDDVDVLVIHEGVTDIMERKGLWQPDGVEVWFLYSIVPCLVRTSGRGLVARHLLNCIPFLEFTGLSNNTYRNLNKYNLVKILLGGAGNPSDLPKATNRIVENQ